MSYDATSATLLRLTQTVSCAWCGKTLLHREALHTITASYCDEECHIAHGHERTSQLCLDFGQVTP